MNISSATTTTETNWNITNNPSMVSFLGFESNNQRQFCEWETTNSNNSTTIYNHDLNTHTNNPSLYDPSQSTPNYNSTNMSSSSTFVGGNTSMSYPKLSDYSMAAEIIGLNLGRRTYFSSQESAVIDRLLKRPRGFYEATHVPRCQAQGCDIDLSNAKQYHRRHKVCEFHSKATKVFSGGVEQRFCQQCSRFHVLGEFDEGKRSCRKRLADHNRRRRKPPPPKTAEKGGASEIGFSSATRSEMEKSLPSSLSPTHISMVSTSVVAAKHNDGSLPHALYVLGGDEEQPPHDMARSSATLQQESFFNDSTMSLFDRESIVSPYQNLFFSPSNENTVSMDGGGGGGSDPTQHHQEDLQNLLQLGQALFEANLI